jgi:hypothetical protein
VSRPRSFSPVYIPHTKSGRGRLQWYDALGLRHEKLLPGPFASPESLAAKARLELAASPTGTPTPPETVTVAEVMWAYLVFADQYYRDQDGNPTDEVRHLKAALRGVRDL